MALIKSTWGQQRGKVTHLGPHSKAMADLPVRGVACEYSQRCERLGGRILQSRLPGAAGPQGQTIDLQHHEGRSLLPLAQGTEL